MNYKNFLYFIILGLLSSIGTALCVDEADKAIIKDRIFYFPLTRKEMDAIKLNLAPTYPYPHTTDYLYGKEVRLENGEKRYSRVLTEVRIESSETGSKMEPIVCQFKKAQNQVLHSKLNYKLQKNSRPDLMKAKRQKKIKAYSVKE